MTYKRLFDLKYRKGVSTNDLIKRFPAEVRLVTEVAMLEIPEEILKEIVHEEEDLLKLMRLKKALLDFLKTPD